jgi:hypothetical protein
MLQLSKTGSFNVADVDIIQKTTLDTTLTVDDLELSRLYYWRVLRQIGTGGETYEVSSIVFQFHTEIVTAVDDLSTGQSVRCFPNPFTSEMNFAIDSKINSSATLLIADQLGKQIKSISLNLEAGENIISWDGRNDFGGKVSPGLYFAALSRQDGSWTIMRLAKVE